MQISLVINRIVCKILKKNQIIQHSSNIQTLCDEIEGFKPALNNYLLFHSYSVNFFFLTENPVRRRTAHIIVSFFKQTLHYIFWSV